MKKLEKLICIFDQSKKENKYTHYEIAENIDTILKVPRKIPKCKVECNTDFAINLIFKWMNNSLLIKEI
ncbi:hypothetical protein [Mycoplasmopsis canis]|uniref:hypothetical protein n=1 Tax=Mycoplasmopsis canis TaxID=29555 RepID=UPI00025AF3A7|nr:hypothetical protein [Mycoplasmopsis canis]EIE40182.1 hypothetical protein MCANUF33_01676 [Mycoplasmopsis canis UF33]